jgi:hypothetical protein
MSDEHIQHTTTQDTHTRVDGLFGKSEGLCGLISTLWGTFV